tara:strand:- start:380 stop:1192 length:813 start_codon:yes stop_codon:yes gene_type:complete
MNKHLICFGCNDLFAPGLQVLLYSLKKHLSNYSELDFKVFYDNEVSILSKEWMNKLQIITPNLKFHPVNQELYRVDKKNKWNSIKMNAAYFIFEMFKDYGYEKSFFMDSDMLCIRDFSEVFNIDASLIAVPSGHSMRAKRNGWRNNRTKFNTGFVGIDKTYMCSEIYDACLRAVETRKGNFHLFDQPIVNGVLKSNCGSKYYGLSSNFNFRSFGAHGGGSVKDYLRCENKIRILHWSGRKRVKPWTYSDTNHPTYVLWRKYRDEMEIENE